MPKAAARCVGPPQHAAHRRIWIAPIPTAAARQRL